MSSQIKSEPISFYISPEQNCSYLPEEESKTLFLSPETDNNIQVYSALIRKGFRRSGNYIYKPECDFCNACISVRVPVSKFVPDRNQVRCLKKSTRFRWEIKPAELTDTHFRLYQKYINWRHSDGSMYPASPADFPNFLLSDWASNSYLNFYDHQNGKLVATNVFDNVGDGLSAVYTFFDPDYAKFSPGKLSILNLIEQAKNQNADYVYLGYWIKGCKKMAYKDKFRPIEYFVNNKWVNLL